MTSYRIHAGKAGFLYPKNFFYLRITLGKIIGRHSLSKIAKIHCCFPKFCRYI